MLKVLNLYAGIGGNRKLWQNVDVTAVEYNPNVAMVYGDFFPNDTVIVGDAHQYLIEHYDKFDFIWTSPPCPTHSQYRHYVGVRGKGFDGVYPDMALYQEIIFLQFHSKAKWVVENVQSYYDPLIKPWKVGRHYFWSNFYIPEINIPPAHIGKENVGLRQLQKNVGFDLSKYSGVDKRTMLRNCVHPKLGLHVLNRAAPNNGLQATPDPGSGPPTVSQPGLFE